ncbi:laminin subunit alpha-3, putative [Babesia ovis]|uniref:Laminin subunit alpha-3, putative n=1 Tax=Babesia ovis TaxID=5869 RepID=A0A9W5TB93_BABOV|nr:laminin subunit alpha-3, putative [Babesia ovis]
MPDVDGLLSALSDLSIDVEGTDGNSRLISRVSEAVDALVSYIKDDSAERTLVAEFENLHQSICQKHEQELRDAHTSLDRVRQELAQVEAEQARLNEELAILKKSQAENQSISEEKEAERLEGRALKEELCHLRGTEDALTLEIQSLQHKLKMLEDMAEVQRASREDVIKRDKLLYEFLTSSLNITVVSANEKEVQLALLTEPEDRSSQTWDLVTVKLDELDQRTTDYLWTMIERTFTQGSDEVATDPVIDTVRLSL